MAERTQRYTEAERASQRANARAYEGGAKYGGSFASQGLKPQKEMGQSFLKREELKARYGAFADPTWQWQERGGQLYRKALPNQAGRIAAGAGDWQLAPDYVQKAYQNPARRQFFDQHSELANQPGGGYDAWLYQRYLNGLKTDPETGLKANRFGDTYNPDVMGVYSSGAKGGQAGAPGPSFGYPGAGGPPQGPSMAMPGGNMYGAPGFNPGGYIPGYAMPFSMPNYGMPQYQGGNLGGLMAPSSINSPNYRTLQMNGGSSFGTYQPNFGTAGSFGSQPYRNPYGIPGLWT